MVVLRQQCSLVANLHTSRGTDAFRQSAGYARSKLGSYDSRILESPVSARNDPQYRTIESTIYYLSLDERRFICNSGEIAKMILTFVRKLLKDYKTAFSINYECYFSYFFSSDNNSKNIFSITPVLRFICINRMILFLCRWYYHEYVLHQKWTK